MSRSDVEVVVREVMVGVIGRPTDGEPDVTRAEVAEWDSLHHVEMIFAVEDACEVMLDQADLGDLSSFSQIVEAVLGQKQR